MFVFIGARPKTEWLAAPWPASERLHLHRPGREGDRPPALALERDPLPLETSLPGVFVAGDVRNQSIKRVAAAVGEGAMAVELVHQYMGTL